MARHMDRVLAIREGRLVQQAQGSVRWRALAPLGHMLEDPAGSKR